MILIFDGCMFVISKLTQKEEFRIPMNILSIRKVWEGTSDLNYARDKHIHQTKRGIASNSRLSSVWF